MMAKRQFLVVMILIFLVPKNQGQKFNNTAHDPHIPFNIQYIGSKPNVGRGVMDTKEKIENNKITENETNKDSSFLDIFETVGNFFMGEDGDDSDQDGGGDENYEDENLE